MTDEQSKAQYHIIKEAIFCNWSHEFSHNIHHSRIPDKFKTCQLTQTENNSLWLRSCYCITIVFCLSFLVTQVEELEEIERISTSHGTPETAFHFKQSKMKLNVMFFKRNVFESRRRPKGVLRPKMKPMLRDIVNVCVKQWYIKENPYVELCYCYFLNWMYQCSYNFCVHN